MDYCYSNHQLMTCDAGDGADSGSQSWILQETHVGEDQERSLSEAVAEEGRCGEGEQDQGCQDAAAEGTPGTCSILCSHSQSNQMTTAGGELAAVTDAVDVGASGVVGKVVVAVFRRLKTYGSQTWAKN